MAAGMASARVGLSDQEWLGFWHGAISGFKNPSYTYVIRIDIKDWRVHEREIMGIYSKDLPSMLDEMVDGEKELLLGVQTSTPSQIVSILFFGSR